LATIAAVIISFALATLITNVAKHKISLHVNSAAGTATACWRLSGPVSLALSPLVVLIAWARRILEAYTTLQAITEAALAMTVTITTFRLFGLL